MARRLFAVLLILTAGCAHHRQVYYPRPSGAPVQVRTGDAVHVRAPFVNVHVQKEPRPIDEVDEVD